MLHTIRGSELSLTSEQFQSPLALLIQGKPATSKRQITPKLTAFISTREWKPCTTFICPSRFRDLEQIPQKLVVHLVMELDFLGLDESAQSTRAAVSRGLLQIRIAALHIVAE